MLILPMTDDLLRAVGSFDALRIDRRTAAGRFAARQRGRLRLLKRRSTSAEPDPTNSRRRPPFDLDEAFWQTCHGGQRRMGEQLLALGADSTWPRVPPGVDDLTSLII